MAERRAEKTLQYLEKEGKENSLQQYVQNSMSEDAVYSFAWKGLLKESSEHEAVIEWTNCPIARALCYEIASKTLSRILDATSYFDAKAM